MPKDVIEERLRWIKPILEKKITIKDMCLVCPFSERTLKYWLSNYKKYGEEGLNPKSTRPHTNPNETPIRIKERIIELRKETGLCAFKLNILLKEEKIALSERLVNKIIKEEGLTRKYRVRKIKYKYVKALMNIGDMVEVDIKYVPCLVNNAKYYQFTMIDKASRWRYLKIYSDMSTYSAIEFLKEAIVKAPFKIKSVKTDNGPCFTNRYTGYLKSRDPMNPRLHAFDQFCLDNGLEHYLIDPGKPAQNGTVERSHRTDQESFYEKIDFTTIDELEYKLKLWNMYYNDNPHCALNGLSPNEFLRLSRVQYVCS